MVYADPGTPNTGQSVNRFEDDDPEERWSDMSGSDPWSDRSQSGEEADPRTRRDEPEDVVWEEDDPVEYEWFGEEGILEDHWALDDSGDDWFESFGPSVNAFLDDDEQVEFDSRLSEPLPNRPRVRKGIAWTIIIALVVGSFGAFGIPLWLSDDRPSYPKYIFPTASSALVQYRCQVTLSDSDLNRTSEGETFFSLVVNRPCLNDDGVPVSNWIFQELISITNLSPGTQTPETYEFELGGFGGFTFHDLVRTRTPNSTINQEI